ncbi:MAG: hypothetical protein OXE79_01625 [Acidimicrobiaceae bacterium]|nr:hypothetical protein [Acidimicrobiaceae bacterium]MCY4174781.1 hypothetical protein [Acidimicrobiaceae bacterium]MCY4280031.1 hypothetical protein [Acidimicrobiaceae bacterium]MCY4295033.1 hypothetical protein [Acidimicrobiaceae bacterium]
MRPAESGDEPLHDLAAAIIAALAMLLAGCAVLDASYLGMKPPQD